MKTIICKPKISAYFSVGFFLVICYSWLIYLLNSTMQLEQAALWRYVIMSVLAAFATILSIRFFGNFKIITVRGQQLLIHWPLLFKRQQFAIGTLQNMEAQQVKTPTGVYEQLLLHFPQKTIKVGNQEYEAYESLKAHLQKSKSTHLHPKASKRKGKR